MHSLQVLGIALAALLLTRVIYLGIMVACGTPHVIIERAPGEQYLLRWWVIPRNNWFNIYLHKFLLSDEPVFHDHPYSWLSVILWGGYTEVRWPSSFSIRKAGSVRYGRAEDLHYIELFADWKNMRNGMPGSKPAWTLFITGERRRMWGFRLKEGWVPWTERVSTGSSEKGTSGPS